jgi:3-oxoacyl-[acyl-carrier protein] reductase
MSQLSGKVALVTGGSRGIGRAIAERLGRDGAAVVVNYRVAADRAEEVASAIRRAGGRAITVAGDVANTEDVKHLFDTTAAEYGGLDILVNNAWRSGPKATIGDSTETDFDQAFAIVKGTFLALSAAARTIRDGGRIINISTSLTTGFWPNGATYVGAKAAIEQFSRTLSKEIGHRGVTVNIVSPGPVRTDANSDPDNHTRMLALTSVGRIGIPEDIGAVVAFLAGPDAGFITGQNLAVNGGVR